MTNTEKNLFEGIYGDLFGSGANDPVFEEKQPKPSTAEPKTGAETPKSEKKEPEGEAEEASVKKAQDVLKEARELLKSDPVLETKKAKEEETAKAKEPEEDPMETLEKLVGLTQIKEDVKELTAFVKVQKLRKEQGMKTVPVSLHLVFTGNPGTGKTTVARILAGLYRQMGVLSKGQLVE
ncbi:MAG: AAA family ATPase, partial [Eubacteriales bacterium]|nr:AAA family ATPase [Eubacteriales bacterium]